MDRKSLTRACELMGTWVKLDEIAASFTTGSLDRGTRGLWLDCATDRANVLVGYDLIGLVCGLEFRDHQVLSVVKFQYDGGETVVRVDPDLILEFEWSKSGRADPT